MRYSKIYVLLLAAMVTAGSVSTATAQSGPTVHGNVYGGGNLATVGKSVTVNISGGTVDNDVYGGGALAETNTANWNSTSSTFSQTYHEVTLAAGTPLDGYYQDAAGTTPATGNADGSTPYYKKTETIVKLTGGTVTHDVYGGGLGRVASGEGSSAVTAVAANVYGDVTVNVTGGTARDVFGANNIKGAPTGVVAVNINGTAEAGIRNVYGGGNQAAYAGSPTVTVSGGTVTNDVYGGGLSADVAGTVTVNIQGGTVTRDVYGGGALANTGGSTVNIIGGTVTHDIYGGGLGDADHAATVNGTVTVNIGKSTTTTGDNPTTTYSGEATIGGSVFGCNNTNGSPQGDVTVNVYKTAHTDRNKYPKSDEANADLDDNFDVTYAIKAVYGGGNLAHYTPAAPSGTDPAHITTVHVYACSTEDANTVKAVYGGGNAADVGTSSTTANTHVIIDGGRFLNVFGGGNGSGDDNPGANINGTATTDVKGGLYNQIFGGSDSKGDVTTVNLSIEDQCGVLRVNDSFGGANMSDLTGNVTTTLTCNGNMTVGNFYGGSNQADIDGNVTLNVYGGTFDNVFGGSKGVAVATSATDAEKAAASADITGDVTLNLYGGTITDGAFGGSNINGKINGKITVNVLNNGGTCALNVNNIYGGGNVTPYTPTYDLGSGETERISPVVNVIHGTVTNVFGGAKGSTATVKSSPQVNIGYDETTMGGLTTLGSLLYQLTQDASNYTSTITDPDDFVAEVTGNVYGGGDLAGVTGNTTVYLRKANTSVGGSLFGGGNEAVVSGNTAVNVDNGTVTQDVYGGGALANVGTNASNTTQVTVTNGTIRNIYGGGLGRLSASAVNYTQAEADEYNTAHNLQSGDEGFVTTETVKTPAVPAKPAYVNGAVTVAVNGGTVTEVFGCNNLNGAPQSTVEVNITNGNITNVFGGGNQAAYTGTPDVNISGGTITKVFGGGNEAGTGGSDVAITAGTISGGVYGGCNTSGTITGNTTVTLTGGTIGAEDAPAEVCGGGLGKDTKVTNSTTPCTSYVYVGTATDVADDDTYTGSTTLYGDIYGGSAYGEVDNTEVNLFKLDGTSFGYNVFGGGKGKFVAAGDAGNIEAKVNGTAMVNMYALTIAGDDGDDDKAAVYGGCNVNGTATAAIVNLIGGTIGSSGTEANKVFGGGKGHQTTTNTATVNVGTDASTGSSNIYSNVYGGSALGAVGTTNVNLNKVAALTGDVFGGGMGRYTEGAADNAQATVTGTATVNLNDGFDLAGNIYGGCNIYGETANAEVNLIGGTVGTETANSQVYGGGKGAKTTFTTYNSETGKGTIAVNLGSKSTDATPVYGGTSHVYGKIYGGSENGSVQNVDVNLYGGIVTGDVFGGGYDTTDPTTVAAAKDVKVTLDGAYVSGSIFGCNDTNGSPSGTAEVHIFRTTHLSGTTVSDEALTTFGDYELKDVYGGGNLAAFTGTTTKVVIESCDPSIETVYGGGNAANATNTEVIVKGAYEIGTVFGGGNGENGAPDDPTQANYANVTGTAKTVLNGGRIHDFYGGSNLHGDIGSVSTGGAATGGTDITIDDLYTKDGTGCLLKVDNIYGAGKLADVIGGVKMTMGCLSSDETIDYLYGGAKNANINGDVTLTVTSGKFTNVFGGNDAGGTIGGSITVNIEETGCKPLVIENVYGGGNLAPYTGSPTVNLKSFTSIGNVYGGGLGAAAIVTGNSTVNINQVYGKFTDTALGTIGNVYGGGSAADVVGDATVNIGTLETVTLESLKDDATATSAQKNPSVVGAKITGNVYGGGYGKNTTVTGDVKVNIGGEKTESGTSTYIGGDISIDGSVYGGSALGTVNATTTKDTDGNVTDGTATGGTTTVTLKKGTVSTAVFGGGQGDADTQAKVYGKGVVNFYGEVIAEGLYGGCDANGKMFNGTELNLYGGRIGNAFTAVPEGGVPEIVFGGGLGALTIVEGAVNVNVGTAATPGSCTIYSNVYGGSKNGSVATANVNLYGGTIWGNVFGGGYRTADGKTAATDVNVTLDGTEFKCLYSGTGDDRVPLTGQIFGCNNLKGTPTGHVMVWVKQTKGSTKNIETVPSSRTTYDVAAVYGGGNQADYIPTKASGTDAEKAQAFAEVLIEGCGKTSIENVYGGGNAAAVPATEVTVKGTYIIDKVFGGGNGAGTGNPGANVGKYGTSPNYTNYGTGKAVTKLLGGYINTAYGGSNTEGDILGGTEVLTKKKTDPAPTGDCCAELIVGDIYGAGSHATLDGDVNIILECLEKDYVGAVYGGAEEATVNGNVTLTVTSGKFGRVFGGNNKGGSINGIVTVYVREEGCDDLEIGELFGGGNQAPYSKYGCNDDDEDGVWTPNEEIDANLKVHYDATEKYKYPVRVFVESCTSIGSIYGGGLGSTATVTGDTYVNINMLYGSVNSVEKTEIGRIGQVFGGGKEANVKGDTRIDVGTETASEPIGVIITGDYTKYLDPLSDTYTSIPASEAGVYGGGKKADVLGNTTLNIGTVAQDLGVNIVGNIYGGGQKGDVTGNTEVNLCAIKNDNGTPNDPSDDTYTVATLSAAGVTIDGNVFGAGQGDEDNYKSAVVKGNSTVNMANGAVLGNIYGGGELSSVGDFTYNDDADVLYVITGCKENTGTATVNIMGGTVGTSSDYTYTDGTTLTTTPHGNVFAGSKGELKKSDNTYLDNWLKFARVKNTVLNVSGGTIMSNIYGGGEIGLVGYKNSSNALVGSTTVTVSGGTIGTEIKDTESKTQYTIGSIFGGGYGSNKESVTDVTDAHAPKLYAGRVYGSTSVTMTGGEVKASVYGGGQLASVGATGVGGDAIVKVSGGTIGIDKVDGKQYGGATMGNVYGGGSGDRTIVRAGQIFGNTRVTVSEADHDNNPTIIYHNIYGGGAYGSVGDIKYGYTTSNDPDDPYYNIEKVSSIEGLLTENTGTATVTVTSGTIGVDGKENGMVFGSSRGDVGAPGERHDLLAWVYDTKVVIGNENNGIAKGGTGAVVNTPLIKGSVYGSGENGHTYNNAVVEIHGGKIGIDDTTVDGGAAYGYRGNVYGAGCGTDMYDSNADGTEDSYNPLAGVVYGTASVTMDGGYVVHNVYGAGAMGSVGKTNTDGSTSGGETTITIKGGRIGYDGNDNGNVYGAARGEVGVSTAASGLANVKESTVNINYPTTPTSDNTDKTAQLITGSVYGGGEAGTVKGDVKVEMIGGYVMHDVYGGGALADSNTSSSAETGAKMTKTEVNLYGGLIGGDAYGGGLGRLAKAAVGTEGEAGYQAPVTAVEAKVYGDVAVTLGTIETEAAPVTTATAFNISYYGDHADVVKSGRVFGCNNLNGSPQGDVKVTVNKTVAGNMTRTAAADLKNESATHQYEVAAVYGGGNLANYTANNKKLNVIINRCDVSVREVYGGGNAAAVPGTDVLVNGAYEIGTVFGGGNGKDDYWLNGQWNENQGANVNGNTNTLLLGGYIHEAYGGSNEKGTITGDISIDAGDDKDRPAACEGCPLEVGKIVGAGKNADVKGTIKMIMGCKPETKIPLVYGGADNANVDGNVELTITSGHFGKVFGGNNEGGIIMGYIKLNIEETGECATPITIDELYLGGNQAAYSKYGYYVEKNADGTPKLTPDGKLSIKPRESAMDAHKAIKSIDGNEFVEYTDEEHFTSYSRHPELNVISCTKIGTVFGGGYGERAVMYANPTVNINMIPGSHAKKIDRDGNGTADNNAHALGEIGTVYGGGNAAAVHGNTMVNIGTATSVTVNSWEYDPETKEYTAHDRTVEGAYVTGNIYGGGNLADVTGNTNVNICAKYDEEKAKYMPVVEGESKVVIAGDVYGGGKGKEDTFTCEKAMVGIVNEGIGSTSVNIGNGTVAGNVFGGGEVGRVEHDTEVTVGLDEGTSTPVVKGSVFGAGSGLDTHGYSALVRGSSTVIVQGNAKVQQSVYGGGEKASVGRYYIATTQALADQYKVEIGEPYDLMSGGKCTVIIQGNAEIGPDGMQMTAAGGPDDAGHVFGAGKGVLPYEGYDSTNKPWRMYRDDSGVDQKEYYDASNEADYFKYIKTLALNNDTEVTIAGNAFVKGSVYGGSENGRVRQDTKVKILGGQIGAGEGMTEAYKETDWAGSTTPAGGWKECAHWTYDTTDPDGGKPYDKYAGTEGYDAKGGAKTATDGHTFYGNVFGGGSGYYPYAPGKWYDAAGQVYGNTLVEITGGHILTSVYGGCEVTDVKRNCTITMSGGTIGVPQTDEERQIHPVIGNIFGAGKGDKRILFNTWTNVDSTKVNVSGGTVYGNVYGGGEDGHVLGLAATTISGSETGTIIGITGTSGYDGNVFGGGRGSASALTAGVVGGNVKLNIQGGLMKGSVYGGGRLASVGTFFALASAANYGRMQDGDDHGNIVVNLTGGTIKQNVFGGCMGSTTDNRLGVSKNVTVNLNGYETTTGETTTTVIVADDKKGCVVKGSVFGCNNLESSPLGDVLVHVYGTQKDGASQIANTAGSGETAAVENAKTPATQVAGEFDLSSFDVKAVYGGGNLAAYKPQGPGANTETYDYENTTKFAKVIIDGCGRTSIGHVYGGGNAASTPATEVTVNGTYEIGELFGGGNGKDDVTIDGVTKPNPGANVGYYNYSIYEKDGDTWKVKDDPNYDTKEKRLNSAIQYGTGKAAVNIFGGTIHRVFGGSNTKGNVRQSAITLLEEAGGCEFCVDEAYGGGKSAPMDAEAKLLMACIPGLKAVYGGAQAADVYDDVTVTVTNGNFDRVFGGNNLSGTIRGKITVNVEETGCRPVIIGELYGGGNQAGYSVYGYNDDGSMIESGETPLYQDPQVNVRSFTSIGNIYGGGYGEGAKMVGNPTVNINVVEGDKKDYTYDNDQSTYKVGEDNVPYYDANGFKELTLTVDGHSVVLPSHTKGKIGAINNVFGGGNAAKVVGNTNVNVGTLAEEYQIRPVATGNSVANYYTRSGEGTESSPYIYTQATGNAVDGTTYYEKKTVIGADIRGNVYGGGNNAEVTGNTNVTIGQEKKKTE